MLRRILLPVPARAGVAALALVAALATSVSPGHAGGRTSTPYIVSRTANGVQITLRFARRSYPQHALVAVTVTLRNVSHANLDVPPDRLPFGVCSWPDVTLTSVNRRGQPVEPNPVIQPPAFPCPAPLPTDLPRGHTMVEHQMIELWSARLQAVGQGFNHISNGFYGFSIPGPTAVLQLQKTAIPTIETGSAGGVMTATMVPAPSAGTPVYYQSWGTCSDGEVRPLVVYWTAVQGATVSSGCAHPVKWHVDMATLNGPVASLDLVT